MLCHADASAVFSVGWDPEPLLHYPAMPAAITRLNNSSNNKMHAHAIALGELI